ncbi:hypothetical protein IQ07DRAFT_32613 [Pyrenochaeta sp. DS3sAY3a]|nr:hypothetical protein IQ07DRAFT_32613 [Pyrenochaeta sp. DS3sAY3a]
MDPLPTASSLYGPGTFICWLCSLVSVLISWRFNRHSKTHDTITNNFLATLTLPGIAAVHFIYAMLSSAGEDGYRTYLTVTLEATSCICVWYSGVGGLLVLLAIINRSPKRLLCTLVVHCLCFSVSEIIPFTTLADISIATQNVKFFLFVFSWVLVLFIPFIMRAALYDRNWQWISWQKNQKFCTITAWFTICWALSFALLLHSSYNFFAIEPNMLRAEARPWLARLTLPRSGIAITELDQIVAIVAGVLTLLVTVKESITSRNMSHWARYEA